MVCRCFSLEPRGYFQVPFVCFQGCIDRYCLIAGSITVLFLVSHAFTRQNYHLCTKTKMLPCCCFWLKTNMSHSFCSLSANPQEPGHHQRHQEREVDDAPSTMPQRLGFQPSEKSKVHKNLKRNDPWSPVGGWDLDPGPQDTSWMHAIVANKGLGWDPHSPKNEIILGWGVYPRGEPICIH